MASSMTTATNVGKASSFASTFGKGGSYDKEKKTTTAPVAPKPTSVVRSSSGSSSSIPKTTTTSTTPQPKDYSKEQAAANAWLKPGFALTSGAKKYLEGIGMSEKEYTSKTAVAPRSYEVTKTATGEKFMRTGSGFDTVTGKALFKDTPLTQTAEQKVIGGQQRVYDRPIGEETKTQIFFADKDYTGQTFKTSGGDVTIPKDYVTEVNEDGTVAGFFTTGGKPILLTKELAQQRATENVMGAAFMPANVAATGQIVQYKEYDPFSEENVKQTMENRKFGWGKEFKSLGVAAGTGAGVGTAVAGVPGAIIGGTTGAGSYVAGRFFQGFTQPLGEVSAGLGGSLGAYEKSGLSKEFIDANKEAISAGEAGLNNYINYRLKDDAWYKDLWTKFPGVNITYFTMNKEGRDVLEKGYQGVLDYYQKQGYSYAEANRLLDAVSQKFLARGVSTAGSMVAAQIPTEIGSQYMRTALASDKVTGLGKYLGLGKVGGDVTKMTPTTWNILGKERPISAAAQRFAVGAATSGPIGASEGATITRLLQDYSGSKVSVGEQLIGAGIGTASAGAFQGMLDVFAKPKPITPIRNIPSVDKGQLPKVTFLKPKDIRKDPILEFTGGRAPSVKLQTIKELSFQKPWANLGYSIQPDEWVADKLAGRILGKGPLLSKSRTLNFSPTQQFSLGTSQQFAYEYTPSGELSLVQIPSITQQKSLTEPISFDKTNTLSATGQTETYPYAFSMDEAITQSDTPVEDKTPSETEEETKDETKTISEALSESLSETQTQVQSNIPPFLTGGLPQFGGGRRGSGRGLKGFTVTNPIRDLAEEWKQQKFGMFQPDVAMASVGVKKFKPFHNNFKQNSFVVNKFINKKMKVF